MWKIEGNPLDPLSNGRLCPRGTGGIGAHFDPDRLRSPLFRVSERGEEKWKAVTWDEALSFIADKMQKIKSTYGPESIAAFIHGIGGTFFKHTLRAYGTDNIAAPSFAQCRGPRDVGFTLTYGDDVKGIERTDIENAQCIVLIGSHIGENMHNTQVQEFANAVGRGATSSLPIRDSRLPPARQSIYLPVKPGTDIALHPRVDERNRRLRSSTTRSTSTNTALASSSLSPRFSHTRRSGRIPRPVLIRM